MKFILFYGAIEPLNHFTSELNLELLSRGHQTCIIDLVRGTELTPADITGHIDAFICFDGIGMLFSEIAQELNAYMINILVDHPMTFSQYMKQASSHYIQIMVDRDHVSFCKRFYNLRNAFFIPHMGTAPIADCTDSKKDIDLLFPASFLSYNTLYEQIKQYPPQLQSLLFHMIEYLLENPFSTIENAMEEMLRDASPSIADDKTAYYLQFAKPVDTFVRNYFREKVLLSIAQAELPITIIGSGWDASALTRYNNARILQGKNFADIFPYMNRSRIVLTVMPWFKDGSHERILNTLLSGSTPLTDESKWLRENFVSNEEIVFFSLEHTEEVPLKICELLQNPNNMEYLRKTGQKKAMAHFARKNFVNQLLFDLEKTRN